MSILSIHPTFSIHQRPDGIFCLAKEGQEQIVAESESHNHIINLLVHHSANQLVEDIKRLCPAESCLKGEPKVRVRSSDGEIGEKHLFWPFKGAYLAVDSLVTKEESGWLMDNGYLEPNDFVILTTNGRRHHPVAPRLQSEAIHIRSYPGCRVEVSTDQAGNLKIEAKPAKVKERSIVGAQEKSDIQDQSSGDWNIGTGYTHISRTPDDLVTGADLATTNGPQDHIQQGDAVWAFSERGLESYIVKGYRTNQNGKQVTFWIQDAHLKERSVHCSKIFKSREAAIEYLNGGY